MLNHLWITLKTIKLAIFQRSGRVGDFRISSYSSPLHSAILTMQLKIIKRVWKQLPNTAESTAVEADSISYPSTVCLFDVQKICTTSSRGEWGVHKCPHSHNSVFPIKRLWLSNILWSLPLGTTADEWSLLFKWHSSKNNCPIRTRNNLTVLAWKCSS